MANSHKLLLASIVQVKGLTSGATLDLNPNLCKYLSHNVHVTTKLAGFQNEDFKTKIREHVSQSRLSKALLQLYSVVKRAENLVQRCCVSKGLTWPQRALTLFAMEDDVLDIILHVQWWTSILTMLVEVRDPSTLKRMQEANRAFEQRVEQANREFERRVKQANREFEQILKDNNVQLQNAAEEDKQHLLRKVNEDIRVAEVGRPGKKKRRSAEYLLLLQVRALLTGKDEDPTSDLNYWKHDGVRSLVGQGSFGVVHRVRWCGYGCVLKQYDGSDLIPDDTEVKNMKRFHHPNIVRLFRHWRDEKCERFKSHLLMERMEKDLEEHIKAEQKKSGKTQALSEPVAVHIMLQVINATWHMHRKDIVHRDLKPKNVLVRLDGKNVAPELSAEGYVEVKLGDFGIAKDDMDTSHEGAMTKNTGTPLYRAPELALPEYTKVGARKFPHKLDIWSFGIMCSRILTGKQPFEEAPLPRYEGVPLPNPLKAHIEKGGRPFLPDYYPDYLRFCIGKCWEKKPENRPKALDVWRMLRVAQLRSLGLITENYDLFSFKDRDDTVVELTPARPEGQHLDNDQRRNKQTLQRGLRYRRTKSKGSRGDRSAAVESISSSTQACTGYVQSQILHSVL